MLQCTLERVYLPTETLGSLYDWSGSLLCKTMELPWKDNKNSISCIPEHTYLVKKELTSPNHKYPHFRLPNVPGRQGILIHKITYVSGLLGCIGVGGAFKDLNSDGVPDIIDSTKALEMLIELLPLEFELIIKKKDVSIPQ